VPFAAGLSEHPDPAVAVGEVAGRVLETLGPAPDLALLFVTAAHLDVMDEVVEAVLAILEPGTLLGAAAASVVGTGREVEERPAVALWAGNVGPLVPLQLHAQQVGPDEVGIVGWPDEAEPGSGSLHLEPSALVLVADPYTFPAEALFAFVEERWPGLPVIGGMASAARAPGGNRLVLDGDTVTSGAVGVLLGGGVEVEAVVSQGCRPIGMPWAVTDGEGNIVRALAGQPPLQRLVQLAEHELDADEVAAVNSGRLHVGRVIDERKAEFGPGDFLVRNVMGGDRSTGAMAIGDAVEVGTTLQFHLRDADAADEELRSLLAGRRADAALVFTCNGRGTFTFGAPDHDAAALADELGAIPAAGFFAAGEFGPIGGRNFVHGFTASIALLRDRVASR
jgi:small ligand-binding sensory domain FIST